MAAIRNTKQKEAVLKVLSEMGNHPCAEDVSVRVRNEYPSIGRSSIFRILAQMAEQGNVLRIKVPDGADRFDHRAYPHCHAKCVKCGKVVDTDNCITASEMPFVDSMSGFTITGYSVLLEGICEDCSKSSM